MSSQGCVELRARVKILRYEADDAISVVLEPVDGMSLHAWDPGSHIDLILPNGVKRQYSLIGTPDDLRSYEICVHLDASSRGGSEYVHLFLRPGQVVGVRGPRNNFPLQPADEYHFIAGGIGITALIAMIAATDMRGMPWRLDYAARSRDRMVLRDRLDMYGDEVHRYLSQQGERLHVADTLAESPGAHVYCCGPQGLLEDITVSAAQIGIPDERLHIERFKPSPRAPAPPRPVTLVAARSGISVECPPERSILDALHFAGLAINSSCRAGLCGSCEVKVLEGVPEHLDDVLTPMDHEKGDKMMVCVSRALTDTLVLDV